MNYKIAVIRGDGIGPEIIDAAIGCLDAVARRYGHNFDYSFPLMGGAAIDATGVPLPQETIDDCRHSDAVLVGPVGGPKWNSLAPHLLPERGILGLRSALGLYAGVHPIVLHEQVRDESSLKPSIAKRGINMVLVRELTGGIYFGQRGYKAGKLGQEAYDTEGYSKKEIERIAKVAFDVAMGRDKRVVSIDKASILESGQLWRNTVTKVAAEYPEIKVTHMLVDTCAMELVRDPSQFDVVLCPNMFGEILSNEIAMLVGTIGLLPESNLGATKTGMYGPSQGPTSEIAGLDAANPIGTILASAMMLSTSLGLTRETAAIDKAVNTILNKGYRTYDIAASKSKKVTCSKMGELIALEILNAK